MAVPVKGLKNVRTLAGRVDVRAVPHRGFMQITCLEMEKARRNAERASAAARIGEIDRRLAEIESEQQALLQVLAPGAQKRAGKVHNRLRGVLAATRKARASHAGFRFRY